MSSSSPAIPTTVAASGMSAAASEEFWSNSVDIVFNIQWAKDLQNKIHEFLKNNIEWLGIAHDGGSGPAASSGGEAGGKKMLDFACGNGFLTRVYHPFFIKCVGVDIASGMIKKYNEAAIELGLGPEKMYGVRGDIFAPTPTKAGDVVATAVVGTDLSREEFFNFDFVGIALALHHMEDPESTIVKLVERLKSGGTFLAIDRVEPEPGLESEGKEGCGFKGHHHQHHHYQHHHHQEDGPHKGCGHKHCAAAADHLSQAAHIISHKHNKFSRQQVKDMFGRAGLTDVDILVTDWTVELPNVPNGVNKLFFARGRKV
ncbi:hypothetical protein PABG_03555 [Paracoccidioides brasiliensis Pb03]|nr:hypothetical protein PABG_03555 [Paracoccidioides brasiliensis Pb03]